MHTCPELLGVYLGEIKMVKKIEIQFIRTQHGSLFDRGGADSYYGRDRNPHWWPLGTGNGEMIVKLNQKEIDEYNAGYDENEKHGHKKDYGSFSFA